MNNVTVAGTVTEISVSDGTVVHWSHPVPPNGVILHYNMRITCRTDDWELVRNIEELNVLTIDVSQYIETDTECNVTVSPIYITLWFIHVPLYQVQAVTRIGAGSFSHPPVSVMLVEPSDSSDSSSTPATPSDSSDSSSAPVAAAVSVTITVIVAVVLITAGLFIYIFR